MLPTSVPPKQTFDKHARCGPIGAGAGAGAARSAVTTLSPACQELLAALPVPTLWIDRHGAVRCCNRLALEMLGAPLLGEPWRLLVNQRFHAGASGTSLTLTNGQPIAVTINPFDGGQLLALLVQRSADGESETVLRSARLAEIGKLAAGLAHQLRTPIAAAQMYLDLARETGVARYFDDTQTALDSLTRHTEGLLTLARGEIQSDAELSLEELIDLTVRQARPLVPGDSLQVTNNCPQARLLCNRHLLSGVILNLIENAAQASTADGVIQLSCDQQGDAVTISVRDFGCGIAPELCARLGEPLVTGRPRGTGLGLTMARLVVERHNGKLTIASTPGVGTTVTMQLRTTVALNRCARAGELGGALMLRRESAALPHSLTGGSARMGTSASPERQGVDCV